MQPQVACRGAKGGNRKTESVDTINDYVRNRDGSVVRECSHRSPAEGGGAGEAGKDWRNVLIQSTTMYATAKW